MLRRGDRSTAPSGTQRMRAGGRRATAAAMAAGTGTSDSPCCPADPAQGRVEEVAARNSLGRDAVKPRPPHAFSLLSCSTRVQNGAARLPEITGLAQKQRRLLESINIELFLFAFQLFRLCHT